ncbi:MAG: helix-turn-helix domain-containing protein [Oscillospiraceae bacterium]|nr:helix-turn-helix domain-containing protein [Oscillospiraceae bacterium]
MLFSKRLKELRLEKKLNQSDVGIMLGVTPTQISDMERGRRTTTLEKAVELADYFGVSLDYLVGRTDKREVNL